MKRQDIIPIEYANAFFEESNFFPNGDEAKLCPIVFMVYLLKTGDRKILVDAGCETMPGWDMHNFIGSVNALKNHGVMPDEITEVILTHAHHDHIECVKYFKNAAVYIQKDEYDDGKSFLSQNGDVRIFDEVAEVCDGVKAVKIGGHSKGSSIVVIETEGKPVVIAGDECYSMINVTQKIRTGHPYCAENSEAFIKKYCGGDYEVLLCHDK